MEHASVINKGREIRICSISTLAPVQCDISNCKKMNNHSPLDKETKDLPSMHGGNSGWNNW